MQIFKRLRVKCRLQFEDIRFLQRCERQRIFPKFIMNGIKTRSKERGAEKGVNCARRAWLKFEVKKHHAQIHNMRLELYSQQQHITKALDHAEWISFVEYVDRVTTRELIKKRIRQNNKFRHLRGRLRDSEQDQPKGEKYPFVINKSKEPLTENEMKLLNKGLKYRPPPEKKPIVELAVQIEAAIEKAPFEVKAKVRQECCDAIDANESGRRHSKHEWRAIESLKKKDLVFSHPDKGKGVVVMDKSDYESTMKNHIESGDYSIHETRRKFPVDEFQGYVKAGLKILLESEIISDFEKKSLTVSNPRVPRMYGLPKIHKEGNQIRPVVTTIDAPTSKIAKYLSRAFRKFSRPGMYGIKNSLEFIRDLEELSIEDDEEIVSFDVKALYPSVPEESALEHVREWIEGQDISDNECIKLTSLLEIAVSQKYFQFNNKIYVQESGLAIGDSLSGIIAEVFMSKLEEAFMRESWAPRFYRRYVDDSFAIVKKGEAQNILSKLNERDKNIIFTMEREIDGHLPFLDILVKRESRRFKFEIYRKPTDTKLCIPNNSLHPWKYRLAAFESMAHRLVSVPLSQQDHEKEVHYMIETAKVNGYEESTVLKIINKHANKKSLRNITQLAKVEKKPENQVTRRQMALTYCPPLSDRIQRIGKANGISAYDTTRGTLGDLLINLKDPRRNEEKSGIYEIECATCQGRYRGQTRRRCETRWKEHEAALRNRNWEKSAVADHCMEEEHKIGEKKVLQEVPNPIMLNAWESFHIQSTGELLNIDDAPIRSKLFDKALEKN